MENEKNSDQLNLDIEFEKLKLAKKTLWLDLISKIAIPIALFLLAWATYTSNNKAIEERFAFESNTKSQELRQKEEEIFLKRTDVSRTRELHIANFIQSNLNLIASNDAEAQSKLKVLVEASFSGADAPLLLTKVMALRLQLAATPQHQHQSKTVAQPTSANLKENGFHFVRSGDFNSALRYFDSATLLNPSDAEAWNFKAYAEMRTGSSDLALRSIGIALTLEPPEVETRLKIALNVSKILCSQGRNEESLEYLNRSAAVLQNLHQLGSKDGELIRICQFKYKQ